MKLILRRGQAEHRGLLGGHKGMNFLLSVRAELEGEERTLVERYRAENELLAVIPTRMNGQETIKVTSGNQLGHLTISNLIQGQSYQCKDVTSLLEAEEHVKQGCENFRILLSVMNSFGGEEVVTF